MNDLICRTCGEPVDHHKPSILDPNGVAHPGHKIERLAYYIQMLDDLANYRITPSKIVGSGYKDARKSAFKWIATMLKEEYEKMMKVAA